MGDIAEVVVPRVLEGDVVEVVEVANDHVDLVFGEEVVDVVGVRCLEGPDQLRGQ